MSWLEIVAVAVSFLAIWLTARRHMACWPVGLLSCALYFKLFLDVRLYADMALQVLFGLSVIYGWIAWARGLDDRGDADGPPARTALVALSLGAVGRGDRVVHQPLYRCRAAVDGFGAQQFQPCRPILDRAAPPASWLLWIVVDTIYVGMFVFKALWLTAGLCVAMTGLAAIGWPRWRRAGMG
jgi:nicotinamide mononucleotide transporter